MKRFWIYVLQRIDWYRKAALKLLWDTYLTKESVCPYCGKEGAAKCYGGCFHIHCSRCMSFCTPHRYGGCPVCYPVTVKA